MFFTQQRLPPPQLPAHHSENHWLKKKEQIQNKELVWMNTLNIYNSEIPQGSVKWSNLVNIF